MDLKITKKRISNVLNYEWVKSLAIVVAIVMVWSLLYTSLATRLTDGQQFYLVTYDGVQTKAVGSTSEFLDKILSGKARENGKDVLSYDVYEAKETDVRSVGSYSASYLLDLRLSVYEGDMLVIGGGNIEYDPKDESTRTDFQNLVSAGRILSIDRLLSGARSYTVGNGFITETSDGYTVNADKIKEYFVGERIKSSRNYRRTYNTDEKIQAGVKAETERIETVYLDMIELEKSIKKAQDADKDFLVYKSRIYEDNGETKYIDRAAYGIDLGKLNAGYEKADIKDLWYTSSVSDGETVLTADGLVLSVFDFTSVQPDHTYEALSVINYIIRNYSDYAD